nr:MAG TPA: hypothetical protein [Caudoviricetes sp.]
MRNILLSKLRNARTTQIAKISLYKPFWAIWTN